MVNKVRSLRDSEDRGIFSASDAALLRALPDSLLVVDRDGGIQLHHPGGTKNRVVDDLAADAETLFELAPPGARRAWQRSLERVFAGRIACHEELVTSGDLSRFEVRLLPLSERYVMVLLRSLDIDTARLLAHPRTGSANDSVFSSDFARELSAAIERDELQLHFQPKLNLVPRYICGVEALVRWQHPERGLLSAEQFIPLAEENNLVDALGDWVLDAACRQAAEWQSTPLADIRVAINLSSQQFHDPRLAGRILRALTRHRLMPETLEIEFREGALLDASASTVETLARLKESGVGVAVDDFGTGFSSLSYLKSLPLDAIKIDRSFVAATDGDDSDFHSMCSAMIALAHSLGLQVIAEGVETEEQLQYLHFLDCDQVQGFHCAKPMTGPAVSSFIQEHRARYPKRALPGNRD